MIDNILTNVRLTDFQKTLLCKIKAASTPFLAGAEVRRDSKCIFNARQLLDLELIEFVNDECIVTDKGNEVLVKEDLADDSGELTEKGQQAVNTQSESYTGNNLLRILNDIVS